MRKCALLTAGLLLSGVALAGSAAPQFGVVNMQEVLQQSPQVEKMKQDLQKQFASRQDKLVAAGKSIKADMDKLHRDGAIMSQKDRDALENKITAARNNFQKMQAELQKDFYAAQDKAMHRILDQVDAVINKTAAKQHLQFVFQKGSLAYVQPGTPDITTDVNAAIK